MGHVFWNVYFGDGIIIEKNFNILDSQKDQGRSAKRRVGLEEPANRGSQVIQWSAVATLTVPTFGWTT